jgi:hypothetical protein
MITIKLEREHVEALLEAAERMIEQYSTALFNPEQWALYTELKAGLERGEDKTIAEQLGHSPDCFMCNHPELP